MKVPVKKKSTRIRKSNPGLKAVLCQVAYAASKSRDTRLAAYYSRLVKRRGPKKAVIALAHLILRIIYHMLKNHVPYKELGPDYLPKKEPSVQHWVRKIKAMGFEVNLIEKEMA